jgi:cell division control protein 6
LVTPPTTPSTPHLPLHARVRALLRPTSNHAGDIAGRDNERTIISDFVNFKGDFRTLYVSGSPGTGKTALVNNILRDVAHNVIFVNCMAIAGLDALWQRLAEELTTTRRKLKGRAAVEAILKGMTSKRLVSITLFEEPRFSFLQPRIIVLDELDHITSSIESLSSLFSVTQACESLRVIGIANTHTLATSDIESVHTLHFAPYTPDQLLSILKMRIMSIDGEPGIDKLLPAPALSLLTKKVAAQTGDVRALFEVLRGAIDIAAAEKFDLSTSTSNVAITPAHILAALKAYSPASANARGATSSETVTKTRNLGLHARLTLLALLVALKRASNGLSLTSTPLPPASPIKRSSSVNILSTSAIDATQLHTFYVTMLTRGDTSVFTPVSRSEFGDLLGMLETVGLAGSPSSTKATPSTPSKTGRRAFGRSKSFHGSTLKSAAIDNVRLADGVMRDEVLRGLGIGEQEKPDVAADVRETEIRAIWAREQARITKDIKAKERAGLPVVAGFEGAIED